MALPDFWTNVRNGAKLFTPRAIVDSPRLDAEAIEHMLRETTHWLTPRVVGGFEKSDFSFLPSGERARLAKLVEDFSRVAAKVGPTAAPVREVVESALPLFREIVAMLEFDRYGDAEAYRLGKQIERELQPYRPKELAELRFNSGRDHFWGLSPLALGVSQRS